MQFTSQTCRSTPGTFWRAIDRRQNRVSSARGWVCRVCSRYARLPHACQMPTCPPARTPARTPAWVVWVMWHLSRLLQVGRSGIAAALGAARRAKGSASVSCLPGANHQSAPDLSSTLTTLPCLRNVHAAKIPDRYANAFLLGRCSKQCAICASLP